MIQCSDISVVVQGAIDSKETKKCLQSIRENLPQAEIILSTWENSDISNFEGLFDILVLSTDPQGVYFKKKKVYHNINRQLVSTKNGLSKVTRNYTLKLRSDLILTSNKFLNWFDKFEKRVDELKLFEHKVLVPVTNSRYKYKPNTIYSPFFISDFWYFGLSSDIKMFFDSIDLVKEPDFSKYFAINKMSNLWGKNYPARFTPEQYFCLSAFNKKFSDIYMQDMMDINDDIVQKSAIAIPNNFIVLEFEQSGIYNEKHLSTKNAKYLGDQYVTLYNNIVYQHEYKKYIDENYNFDETLFFKLNSNKSIQKLKLYKHIVKLIDSKIDFLTKVEQIFLSIPLNLIKYFFTK